MATTLAVLGGARGRAGFLAGLQVAADGRWPRIRTHRMVVPRVRRLSRPVRYHGSEQSSSALDVVICTYSNDRQLEEVLAALAEQDEDAGRWRVLVVDNNSTDDTPAVVNRWAAAGSIPGLRRVVERIQGLTPARQRGVAETDGPWIAFVDDDCVLDRAWVRHAAAFAAAHPDAAGFGGRSDRCTSGRHRSWPTAAGSSPSRISATRSSRSIVSSAPEWSSVGRRSPRLNGSTGPGSPIASDGVSCQVGTSRWRCDLAPRARCGTCLTASSNTASPLGGPSWATSPAWPGVSGSPRALADALTWHRGRRRWLAAAGREAIDALAQVARGTRRARRQQAGSRAADLALMASYELGRLVGLVRVAVLVVTGRCPYFGGAAPIATSPGGTCSSAS